MVRARRLVGYYRAPGGPGAGARLAEQSRACADYARERGWVVIEPFVESARGRRRPELARALERCRDSQAALLVPALGAGGAELGFLDPLLASGVTLHAADAGAVARATLRALREVAAHQHGEASARSRAALRAARARGTRLGSPRPELGSRAGVAALRADADAHAARVAPFLAELLLSNPGASLRELARGLQELGVPTPRAGRWGPSGVRNALRRSGLQAGGRAS